MRTSTHTPSDNRRLLKLGLIFLAISAPIILPTQWLLTSPSTPGGIADLELAGSIEHFQSILKSWQQSPQHGDLTWAVYGSISADFFFLAAYTLLLFYLARRLLLPILQLKARHSAARFLVGNAKFTPIAFLLAGGNDVLENLSMIMAILIPANALFPAAAAVFATLKFLLLMYGMLSLLSNWVWLKFIGKRAVG